MNCAKCGERMVGTGGVRACVRCKTFRSKHRPVIHMIDLPPPGPVVLKEPWRTSRPHCPRCGVFLDVDTVKHWEGCNGARRKQAHSRSGR